jgi:RNA polymerase sigma-70 factor (ECF subfamily)
MPAAARQDSTVAAVVLRSGNQGTIRDGTFSARGASIYLEAVVKDDAQLIDESLAGEPAAFGVLVTRYQDRLYNTLVHVLSSVEDARDVAQDAFVQAFIKLESFRRDSAFYTWLYRIAMNLAISHRRRRRRCASIEQMSEVAGGEPADGGSAPGEILESREQVAQVHQALRRLSEEHRVILVLREMDGHDYETISEVLDLPIGTVRSRLHRARIQMREQLREVLHEDCP